MGITNLYPRLFLADYLHACDAEDEKYILYSLFRGELARWKEEKELERLDDYAGDNKRVSADKTCTYA